MPRLPSWPETQGQPVLLSAPDSESFACFDLRRDGTTEVSVQLRVPFKSPKGNPNQYGFAATFSANVYLLGQFGKNSTQLNKLLSSVTITGEGSAESYRLGSDVTGLMGAVDIDGDGVAEVVLAHVQENGATGIRVYKLTTNGLLPTIDIKDYWPQVDY